MIGTSVMKELKYKEKEKDKDYIGVVITLGNIKVLKVSYTLL